MTGRKEKKRKKPLRKKKSHSEKSLKFRMQTLKEIETLAHFFPKS